MSKLVLIGVLCLLAGFGAGFAVGRGSTPQPPSSSAALSESPPTGGGVLSGRVAEVIQVPQYTYLRLETGEWAAVSSAPSLSTGQQVVLNLENEMKNFSSPSLGRTFASVWFGSLQGAGSRQVAAELQGALKAVDSSGALTLRVADVYAERAVLAGKRVRVKGTVDRVNFVQGLHYVHLKDGTGASAEKTDDLLCIASAEVAKGAVVSMEGVVAVDKNVGMGVNAVVLEGATEVK